MGLKSLSRVVVGSLLLGSATGCMPWSSADGPELTARLVETSNQGGAVQGFYMGELEMVAYDHRPGQTRQAGQHFGFTGTQDWSFWVAIQSGHEAARDVVLQPGQQLDSATLNDGITRDGPDREFVTQVGVFDIDLFEVLFHRTGVIHNNVYYGMNADLNGLLTHPLHKYPAWASIEDRYCEPEYPGSERSQDLNVFFVRSDWFPQAVNVTAEQEPGTTPIRLTITRSSLPLTTDQRSLILSLINNSTQRRGYNNLLFVPMPGPVSVKLEDTGGTLGANEYLADKLRITVNYDMSDILHPDTNWSTPRVRYNGDAHHIPFDLSLVFERL